MRVSEHQARAAWSGGEKPSLIMTRESSWAKSFAVKIHFIHLEWIAIILVRLP